MTPASATAELHVASYKVLLNGSELKRELMDALGEIKVVDTLMLPNTCDLTMFINSYEQDKAIQDVDNQPFKIGTSLVIRAGAIDDRAPTQTVFDGEVVAIDADFGHGGITLGIRAYDRGHKLMRNRKARVFKQQTASGVFKAIIGQNGLGVGKVDATRETHEWIQQDNETDWDFLWRLARNIGYWVTVSGQKVNFVEAGKTANQTTVSLEWPDTIAAFHPRVTGVQQVKSVTAKAWDPKAKTVFSGQAQPPRQLAEIGLTRSKVSSDLGGGSIHISNSSATSRAEVDKLAQATLDRIANAYVEAEAHVPGNPNIKSGAILQITGVGKQFSGKYQCGTVRHNFEGGGSFDTHVSTATATPSSLAAMASGNGRGTKFGDQLVIGIVTNNTDPENLGRVKVKFPALDDQLESEWLRIATPSAGKERGLLMMPQANEEVIVGFENGDTRRGYVLGSLFNGKDTPGKELVHGSDGSFALLSDKQIVATSKDEMKLTSTKKMTVDVKDEQEIKVAKDRKETIQGNLNHSVSGNFQSEAKGSGTLKSSGSYTIESQGSVTIKAPSITVEGQAQLSLKAAQVSIQGSAMVSISGGIINLG